MNDNCVEYLSKSLTFSCICFAFGLYVWVLKSIYQHRKPLGYTIDIICMGVAALKINILLAIVN